MFLGHSRAPLTGKGRIMPTLVLVTKKISKSLCTTSNDFKMDGNFLKANT